MPTRIQQTETKNIPRLRFPAFAKASAGKPGFSGAWEEKKLGEVVSNFDNQRLPISSEKRSKGEFPYYGANGIVDYVDGYIFDGEYVLVAEDGVVDITKYPVHLVDGKFWVNNHAHVLQGSHVLNKFLFYSLLNTKFGRYITGSAQTKLNGQVLNKIKIQITEEEEQQKIADFLSSVDEWLENLRAQKKSLEAYKKGMMQKIFSREIRFGPARRSSLATDKIGPARRSSPTIASQSKASVGGDFPAWEEKNLGDCLDYEQPTDYIVESTEYDDSYKIPVLTAGKSFILGYTNENDGIFQNNLPVIIFDDFTTTSQFVDFPFKVKSSAMKILTVKKGSNIKFIYEAMQLIKYEIGGHGRHWISKFSKIDILVPTLHEQQKIADFLTSLDNLIESKKQQIAQAQSWEKGLMQGLFV